MVNKTKLCKLLPHIYVYVNIIAYIYSALYTTKLTCQIRFFDPKKPLPVKRTAKKLGLPGPSQTGNKGGEDQEGKE